MEEPDELDEWECCTILFHALKMITMLPKPEDDSQVSETMRDVAQNALDQTTHTFRTQGLIR